MYSNTKYNLPFLSQMSDTVKNIPFKSFYKFDNAWIVESLKHLNLPQGSLPNH